MMAGDPADIVTELSKLGARDPESARLLGMIVALASEVFVLKAQVERLTRALQTSRVIDAGQLEAAAADEGMAQWLMAEEAAFSRGLTSPYLQPDRTVNATRWMREA